MVAENLSEGIAFQIRATRDAQGMTQGALAEAAGMSQNNISRLESPDYGKHTVSSLKRIADALDVALVVRLVPFSQYIDWLSGKPYLDRGISVKALAVPEFAKDTGLQQHAIGNVISISGEIELEKPSKNLLEALSPPNPQARFMPKSEQPNTNGEQNATSISSAGQSFRVLAPRRNDAGDGNLLAEVSGFSGRAMPIPKEPEHTSRIQFSGWS